MDLSLWSTALLFQASNMTWLTEIDHLKIVGAESAFHLLSISFFSDGRSPFPGSVLSSSGRYLGIQANP